MKKHLLLAALALPMLFAACSSDDELMEPNAPKGPQGVEGIKVNLGVFKDGDSNATRASWNPIDQKVEFGQGDNLSAFWVNNQGLPVTAPADPSKIYNYEFNTVYKNTGTETGWESEAMLFVGGTMLVYPAQKESYNTNSPIYLSVPAEQAGNEAIKDIMPYYSNYIWIHNQGYGQNNNMPGYHKALKVAMKPAANVLELTLNVKNNATLVSDFNFNIDDVELISGIQKAFATTATITEGVRVKDDNSLTTEPKFRADWRNGNNTYTSIDKVLDVKAIPNTNSIKSRDITKISDTEYKVRFMIFPSEYQTDDNTLAKDARIIVHTNCGRVIIESNKVKSPTASELEADPKVAATGTVKKDWDLASAKDMTIAEAFEDITSYTVSRTSANFKGEKIGKAKVYAVDVDMNKTILNASEVRSDEEVDNYLKLYTALHKTGQMTLIMKGENWNDNNPFKGLTTATLDKINNNDKWSLASLTGSVKLLSGNSVPKMSASKNAFVSSISENDAPDVKYPTDKYNNLKPTINYILAGNKSDWTMDDTFNPSDKVTRIEIASGSTLTIKGTTKNGAQNVVAKNIWNDGTLKIGGNGTVIFGNGGAYSTAYNTEWWGGITWHNSIIEIDKNQNLYFNSANKCGDNVRGTINNRGYLLAGDETADVAILATVNNYSIMASSAKQAHGFVNKGTINVKDHANAITYIQKNENEIILSERNDEVSVQSSTTSAKVTYTWTAADGATVTKKDDDKFTYIKFSNFEGDLTLAPGDLTNGAKYDLSGVSMKFYKEVKLITNGVKVNNVEVNSGNANMKVLTGNILNVEGNISNAGTITVGGKINYKGNYSGNGRILKVGSGTIEHVTEE